MTFRIGDVVRLVSGSPPMTVTRVLLASIEVSWFDDAGHLQQSKFPMEVIRLQWRDPV